MCVCVFVCVCMTAKEVYVNKVLTHPLALNTYSIQLTEIKSGVGSAGTLYTLYCVRVCVSMIKSTEV